MGGMFNTGMLNLDKLLLSLYYLCNISNEQQRVGDKMLNDPT